LKIAFVALPQPSSTILTPPLPLGYIAALLEQQRHIVRIYDLALSELTALSDGLAPLRSFRPHVVVIASDDPAATTAAGAALADCNAVIMPIGVGMRAPAPGEAVAQALWAMDESPDSEDEQSVIFEALLALDDDLDSLPFPARHLLPLEQYPLFTLAGDLQTTILIGQQLGANSIIPRNPALIVAELRSVAREYGIRHLVFSGPPLTEDLGWFHDLLYHLATSDLGINWEGGVRYDCMTPDLLRMCRRSGCEALSFTFDAVEVLGSKSVRATLSSVVEQAHSLNIGVRAHIQLDPPYTAIAALVDIAATFGLDDVRFNIPRHEAPIALAVGDQIGLENVAEMVRSRYRSSRSRQFFVDRFGPRLGPMLWRVGRAGLLGRTWQRYADGGEDTNGGIAQSYSA
jgi:hypothetical protein